MNGSLIVVDGPSGAGKSHLMRFASRRFAGIRCLRKLTTRPARDAEDGAWSDLRHVSEAEFELEHPDYRYRWHNSWYGFRRADLLAGVGGAAACLIVVRHAATIRRLVSDLPDIDVIPVLVLAELETRRNRLLADGLDERDVRRRLRSDDDPSVYRRVHADLFRHVLRNDGTAAEYHAMIERCIGRCVAGGDANPDRDGG